MKRIFSILSIIVVLIIIITIYLSMSQKLDYNVLNIQELPIKVQNKVSKKPEINGFSVYNDEIYTYVLYRANHTENEYISTDLSAYRENGEIIISCFIDFANDDSQISHEKVIRLDKIDRDDIVLIEHDKR
ncbi:hypothetical protein [Bacillus suaedaesalsae]|uniref:DUF3139 domain-containing protein n=1 Tax=Bacillus suaedaesalsae TaxID=2810349 RepID=A0ABS2DD00_9BACI|nr:hypothetical protein [Bacillus suaedaesalsae]MBM6616322.1 hypothetical protein [Bacillus suaedaesalsae]